MTFEDFLMNQVGLDANKVHSIANNLIHILGVAEAQMDNLSKIMDQAKALADQATALAAVVQSEMPRGKKTIEDTRSQIAAFEAKQAQYRQQWRG